MSITTIYDQTLIKHLLVIMSFIDELKLFLAPKGRAKKDHPDQPKTSLSQADRNPAPADMVNIPSNL